MSYRYQPHQEDTKALCERLQEALPNVKFRFLVDNGGLLRMRAIQREPYRDKELLLREQTPDEVLEAFTSYFN